MTSMSVHRSARVLLTFAALGLALAGCGDEDAPRERAAQQDATFPLTLDSCGEPVVFQARPERVLTIGSTAVYQLHAVGASDRIVARSGEFGSALRGPAAAAVADVPVIEPEDPALEPILASGADTVIHYGLFKTTPEALADVGIADLLTAGACSHAADSGRGGGAEEAVDFEDVVRDLEQLGRLFGTDATAARAAARLRERVARASDRADRRSAPRRAAALHFFPGSPVAASGNRSMSHTLMSTVGLENVFADLDKEVAEISTEELVKRDPDVIVLAYGLAGESAAEAERQLRQVAGLGRLAAVRRDRIVTIPAYQRAADVNAVEGLEALADALAELP